MTNNTWAPKVGMAGMDGAALWLLSLVLEYGLGLQPLAAQGRSTWPTNCWRWPGWPV